MHYRTTKAGQTTDSNVLTVVYYTSSLSKSIFITTIAIVS